MPPIIRKLKPEEWSEELRSLAKKEPLVANDLEGAQMNLDWPLGYTDAMLYKPHLLLNLNKSMKIMISKALPRKWKETVAYAISVYNTCEY